MSWVCRECRTKYSSTDGKKPATFPKWDDGHVCTVVSLEDDRILRILNTIENSAINDVYDTIREIRNEILINQ